MKLALAFLAATVQIALAQSPAVSPRRVLNAVTLQPAPSRVTPGGIIQIEGINLGPAEGAKATSMPLPTRLAEPEVEVLINNRSAPLFSVEPNRIVAQVPLETPNGLMQVVVRRGEQRTRPATVMVQAILPSLRTRAENGFGEAAGTRDGSRITLSATGLGPTDPTVGSGEAPPDEMDARPRQAYRVYVGGLLASAEAKLSPRRVGEFDLVVDIPEGASAGDAITIVAANQPPGNRPTLDRIRAPEIQYAPLPQGVGANARIIRSPDLRANYAVVHGARGEDGCFPSWLMDLASRSSSRIGECLIAANAAAASPVTVFPEHNVMVSLVGPPVGEAQAGVANKLALFNPSRGAAIIVSTPRAFTNVAALPDGTLTLAAGGQQSATVNPQTGEIGPPPQGGAGGGVPGGGGAGGGGGVIPGGAVLNVDLGGGLNQVMFAVGVGGGNLIAAVGDSLTDPKSAKFALVNNQGVASAQTDFPDGWLPLLRPAPALPAGPGGQVPGGGALPVAAQRLGLGATATQPNQLFFLARKGESTALLAVTLPQLAVTVVPMPEGWQAAACSPNYAFQVFDTTRQLVLFGARSFQAASANPCSAGGYLLIDPPTRSVRAIPFPKNGSANLRVQPAGTPEINDYLFAASAGTNNPQLYDSLFVLDALSLTPFALAPDGLRGFTLTGQAYRADEISSLVGVGVSTAVGDGGLVLFDLENGLTNVFPVPEGFQSITLVEVFTTTRKVLALGTRTGATGTEMMLFDLDNQDLTRIPNPDGVAFVANLPAQAAPGGGGAPGGGMPGGGMPGGGGAGAAQITVYVVPNTKSNQVVAMCFNANRQPVGVMAVKIP
jgi:uncharacterized protein (TIGR03437 family)